MAEYYKYSLKMVLYCYICPLPWGFLFAVTCQVLFLSSLVGISMVLEELRGCYSQIFLIVRLKRMMHRICDVNL